MADPNFIQVFIRLFDNKTLTLQFLPHDPLSTQSIKHHIETLTQIPSSSQTLTLNGRFLSDSTPINPKTLHLSTVSLAVPLLGGKGGFGSLLRGAATKAGQKKTNNFDACRDMSGRRLRHVNAEKRLEEWKAEQEERRLEKVAEEYLKKVAKKGKGGKKEDGAMKYVEKYREDSAKCVEEVEKSVREMMGSGKKRKVLEKMKEKEKEGVDAKKVKIWMGKRKVDESDTDTSDDDEESDGSDSENEKSVIIDNGHQSDSSKDGSSGSISVPQLNEDPNASGSSDSGSEEEKEAATRAGDGNESAPVGMSLDTENNTITPTEKLSVPADVVSTPAEIVTEKDPSELNSQEPSTSSLKEQDAPLSSAVPEGNGSSDCQSASSGQETAEASDVSQPLNFDNYNSAAELEVLGLERLKSELQARGLKCGGTLQERAARLFLLKTTPVEKLPKKLLAKK